MRHCLTRTAHGAMTFTNRVCAAACESRLLNLLCGSFWQSDELRRKVLMDLERQVGKFQDRESLFWCLGYDFLFVQLVITPLFVITWRGTWENADTLFDQVICNSDLRLSALVSIGCGVVGSFPLLLFQDAVNEIANAGGWIRFILVSRAYTILRFYFDLVLWKGMWGYFDYIIGSSWTVGLMALLCSSAALISIQSFQATFGTPIGIRFDSPSSYISVPTALSSKPSDSMAIRVLDCLITTCIAILAIAAFYGLWTVEDYYFDDKFESTELKARNAAIGTAFGYFCTLVTFVLQFPCLMMHSTDTKVKDHCSLQEFFNLVFYEVIITIALAGNVSTFRGIWILADIYILPGTPNTSRLLCQLVGLMLMFILYTGSTLHGGVMRERNRQRDGILMSHFFITNVLANKSDDSKQQYAALRKDKVQIYHAL